MISIIQISIFLRIFKNYIYFLGVISFPSLVNNLAGLISYFGYSSNKMKEKLFPVSFKNLYFLYALVISMYSSKDLKISFYYNSDS